MQIKAFKTVDISIGRILEFIFILSALFVVFKFKGSTELQTFSITFFSIILEAFPFMLLGALVGGLIEAFLSKEKLLSYFNKRGTILPIIIGASIGLIFPVCECAIVAVIRRLLKKGTPVGAAIAYLIAGPIFNPIVGFSTYIAYSNNFTVMAIRLGSGVIIAVIIGFLTNRFFTNDDVAVLTEESQCCGHEHHHHHDHKQTWSEKLLTTLKSANEDFFGVGKYLVIGAFIAAFTQTFIAREGLISWMSNPLASILLMMVMALVLNLCSESDAFIAATFNNSPIPLAAQMAFMVLGPMLDIKLIIMYLGTFKKRFILFLIPTILILVFVFMLLLHLGGFR